MRLAVALAAVLALSACTESRQESPAPARPAAVAAPVEAAPTVSRPDADGVVRIEATRDAFIPNLIEGKAGQPLKLIFTRTAKKSCMSEAVFPELGIRRELPLDEPVEVTVTPEAGKELQFHCPMGMGKSRIVAVE